MKKFLVVILGMVLLAAVGCGSEQKQADGQAAGSGKLLSYG